MKDASAILVVEDELLIRWSLRNCLQDVGLEVVEADSGEAGLALIDGDGIRAAVVDLRLPGIDGLEVVRQLRKTHPRAHVWIMTAHGTPEAEAEAWALGVDGFVNKPFDFRLLASRVREALTARCA